MKKIICKFEVKEKKVLDKVRKCWICTQSDDSPENIGGVCVCGMPTKAENLPIGTTYETSFNIPEE